MLFRSFRLFPTVRVELWNHGKQLSELRKCDSSCIWFLNREFHFFESNWAAFHRTPTSFYEIQWFIYELAYFDELFHMNWKHKLTLNPQKILMLFTHALLSRNGLLWDTASAASNLHFWSSSILILFVLFPQLIQQIQSLIRERIGIWGCLWKLYRLVDWSHLDILNLWIFVWARIWLRKLIKGYLFFQFRGSWTFGFIPFWLLLWLESINDLLGWCWEAIGCYSGSFFYLLRSFVKLDLAFLRHGSLISEMHKTLIFRHVYITKMRKRLICLPFICRFRLRGLIYPAVLSVSVKTEIVLTVPLGSFLSFSLIWVSSLIVGLRLPSYSVLSLTAGFLFCLSVDTGVLLPLFGLFESFLLSDEDFFWAYSFSSIYSFCALDLPRLAFLSTFEAVTFVVMAVFEPDKLSSIGVFPWTLPFFAS